MSLKKYIPNGLTLLNLLCGSIAALFASNGNFVACFVFVCLGILFDFFDGFLARLLHVQSEVGIQLDSLSDMITSGLVPGVVMYKMLELTSYNFGNITLTDDITISTFPLIGFSITMASAYRLAKFNISDDQEDNFIGLPTPANALLILSFPLILGYQNNHFAHQLINKDWFLVLITILSCYLLNANIKLFALKFKSWDLKSNLEKYGLILLSIVLLVTLKFIAIPLIILIYIVLSIIKNSLVNN